MRRMITMLTAISLFAASGMAGLTVPAQGPGTNPARPLLPRRDFKEKLPAHIKQGPSPEAKAAWESLNVEQREYVKVKIHKVIEKEKEKAAKEKAKDKSTKAIRSAWKDIIKGKLNGTSTAATVAFTDREGNRKFVEAKEQQFDGLPPAQVTGAGSSAGSIRLAKRVERNYKPKWRTKSASGLPAVRRVSPIRAAQGSDGDFDGLSEDFENALADAFTPVYHVSANESDNFSTFFDSVPQTVDQRLGQNPFSYFRVQPLGFAYNYFNQLVSVIRLDYLTLWDHDSGIVTGGSCSYFPGMSILSNGHDLDNERSAALVAAPVSSFEFNLNPWEYAGYSYYTAAHEGVWPVDKSRYIDFPTSPIPAGWHLNLALSWSKHATYTYNPDYLPLMPEYIIVSVYGSALYFCFDIFFDDPFGLGDILCLAALYYAYGVFFECGVERFIDQGGQFAGTRINVGEPNSPINGSHFIQDSSEPSKLYQKLADPVF